MYTTVASNCPALHIPQNRIDPTHGARPFPHSSPHLITGMKGPRYQASQTLLESGQLVVWLKPLEGTLHP